MICKSGHCFKILTVATACGLMTGIFCSCSGKTISQTQITTPSMTQSQSTSFSKSSSTSFTSDAVSKAADCTINSTTSVSTKSSEQNVTSSPTTQNASQNSSNLSKSAKSGTLQNMYTNILNGNALTLSGLGYMNQSEHAINQQETLNKIVEMLESSVPYNKNVPQTSPIGENSNGYLGPLYLTVSSGNGHQVQIQPYVYFTSVSSGPQTITTRHYINNLIEVSDNGNNYYVLSQDLFDWFQNKCKVEFNTQSLF